MTRREMKQRIRELEKRVDDLERQVGPHPNWMHNQPHTLPLTHDNGRGWYYEPGLRTTSGG